ncbi:MAG TPA: TIGR03936 family radical SAM-associated protein, partial [Candidatus Eisenbacteria bacterium]|nr:TIGR03936 family radical SAM-associated protein [Candidatus Eisenbacteria bacterium]
HTPFQWAGQLTMEETRVRQTLLRHELGRRRIEFRWHDARLSFLEGVFARGDVRTADALEAAWRLGARFDGWSECFDFDLWMRAFEAIGMDPSIYLRPRDLEERLPWDHIRTPVVKKFLAAERQKAYAAALTPDCRDHACYRCGAPCFTPKAREGRNVSLQLAPGQGADPVSLDFSVPPDITTAQIEERIQELTTKPIETLRATVEPPKGANGHAAPGVDAATNGKANGTSGANGGANGADGGANGNGGPNGKGDGERAYGRRRRVWPTASRGPQATRYRVAYEKLGDARFTSHLDLVRIFDRAIRVAKIPIAYTQGFNRHAKIAYGPPLSLGSTSAAEYFDLELAQSCPWSTIAAMNEILPEGLRILEGRPFSKASDSLMAAIGRADYRVRLTPYLMEGLTRGEDVHRVRAELTQSIASFTASGDWPVAKQSHGQKGKTVNARPAVVDVALDPEAGPLGVRIASRLQATGYLRPDLLVRSFLPSFDFDPRLLLVHRDAMWVERGGVLRTPLEILEDSAFWRAVPVDSVDPAPADPAWEVDA